MRISRLVIVCFSLAAALASCGKSGDMTPDEPTVHSSPVRLAPYLYEMEFSSYGPSATISALEKTDKMAAGAACSIVRNGHLVGRNLDFFYDEMAEFVVRVPSAPGRYASIGVSSCNINLTAEAVDSGKESPFYPMVPYFMVDGINEKGVFAAVNMAPTGDLGLTSGTNPGALVLYPPMVIRYVLDNCASAREACEKLEKANIKTSNTLGEFHYMIADPDETYIVEIIHNRLRWSREAGNIMTNYYLLHEGLTPHACGMEREAILNEHYDEGETLDGMSALMQRVKYSLMYDRNTIPYWYSEHYGYDWKGQTVTIDTPHEFYEGMIDRDIETYNKGVRGYLNGIWITTHTSVYDFDARSLRVYCQEDYSKHWEFNMEGLL